MLGIGAINNVKGVKGVENCNFLNSLNGMHIRIHSFSCGNVVNAFLDVRRIRNRIVDSFELSSLEGTSDEKKSQLLHFVVVGGGPIARNTAAQLQGTLEK